ncbi:hypothetical protein BSKO_02100 [Bryopsis sp. KO-2023]|nr:hypothetical protein BSKO_02100 [Bryopsis sp. KO-2023]
MDLAGPSITGQLGPKNISPFRCSRVKNSVRSFSPVVCAQRTTKGRDENRGRRSGAIGKLRATLQRSQQDEEESAASNDTEEQPRNGFPRRFLKYLSTTPSPLIESNINLFRQGFQTLDTEEEQTDGQLIEGESGMELEFPNATHSFQDDSFPAQFSNVDVYSLPLGLKLNHPTMRVLEERWRGNSKPGQRRDDFKVGLVVEGGGMRGAVTGGMLMQLHDLGMKDVFDAVYGSSAGAINATYFLSGQNQGLDVYFEHLSNANFMSFRRMFSKDPVMDLDYLVDDVMHKRLPLLWDKVLASEVPLKVIASSLDSLSSVTLEGFRCKHELMEALMASANVPEIAGPPRTVNGERLVDAAVFEPIPYQAAVKDGCTHVLALCSRPRSKTGTKGAVGKAMKGLMTLAIKRVVLNPPYMRAAWQAEVEKTAQNGGISQDDLLLMSMVEGFRGVTPGIGGHVLPLYPPADLGIQPTCLDADILRKGADKGRREVDDLFLPLIRPR